MRNLLEHPITKDEVEGFLQNWLDQWDGVPPDQRSIGTLSPLIVEALKRLITEQWDVVREYFELKTRG